jgi:hypothetical protein
VPTRFTRILAIAAAAGAAVACSAQKPAAPHGAAPTVTAKHPTAAVTTAYDPAADLAEAGLLGPILRSHPGLRAVLAEAPAYRLQVVLGVVDERQDGTRVLVQHGFRSGAEYLYPASTVKLFAAVAALEKLAAVRAATGLPVDADTPLVFHPLFEGELLEDSDPTNLDGGHITVGHEIRKLFLVSDNAAFNRLYELVGPDGIASSLARAGIAGGQVVHRLSEARTPEENRRLPRIDFVGEGFVHTLPERTAPPPAAPPVETGLNVGRAYLTGDTRVEGPMDFTAKNRFPLASLQQGLCAVLRPDVACTGAASGPAAAVAAVDRQPPATGFALGAADRAFLAEVMGQVPRESRNPRYDAAEHPDAEVKWILPGVRRVLPAEATRVHDKTGQAYGFTLENAWVVDSHTGRGFFLAAALYTNSDGVLNDDAYDYETVALPFLADLGEAVTRALLPPR